MSETILDVQAKQPGRLALSGNIARRFAGKRSLFLGMILLIPILVAAMIGPFLTPYDPLRIDSSHILEQPSWAHWMGTDKLGRDVFTRLVHAARLDILIAGSVAAAIVFLGSLLGSLAGYLGGTFDDLIMRVVDVVMAFPGFILAMAITVMLGNRVANVIVALSISYSPYFVRIVRGQMLWLRKMDFAKAAVCAGNPPWRVMYRHLLPNCMGPVLIQASLAMGWAILDAGGLGFLGIGIRPPISEWGVMISHSVEFVVTGEWWTWLFPGAAIIYAVASFNLLGEGLRSQLSAQQGGLV